LYQITGNGGDPVREEQSKGQVATWVILCLILLIGGVLVLMLWLKPQEEMTRPQISHMTQTQNNLTDDPQDTNPADITTETEPTAPTQIQDPSAPETAQPITQPTVPPEQQLVCESYSLFSGAFVEDGSDEPVQNVAALLVTNGSEQYLDLAQMIYDIDGRKAVFMVTGLPAGGSAWVLESTRMTASANSQFTHKNTVTSFRTEAESWIEGIDLSFNGTMLKATNNTAQTFKSLTVYYKAIHTDGNFFGGITYMTTFGDLEPGQSAEKLAGHYQPDNTQIVRIGYQED
jgi:hypothetical protein